MTKTQQRYGTIEEEVLKLTEVLTEVLKEFRIVLLGIDCFNLHRSLKFDWHGRQI